MYNIRLHKMRPYTMHLEDHIYYNNTLNTHYKWVVTPVNVLRERREPENNETSNALYSLGTHCCGNVAHPHTRIEHLGCE